MKLLPSSVPFLAIIMTVITSMGIFTICSLIPFSYAQSEDFQNNNTTSNLTNQTLNAEKNWTTYKNDVLGISFEYPSGWDIKEKENRFDTGADVSVSSGDIKFFVFKLDRERGDNPLTSSGVFGSTKLLEEEAIKDGKTTIIEHTDVTKYKIGGEKTGTYVTKVDDGISPPYGAGAFFIVHRGDGYGLGFRDSTQTFDSPETQSIMNKILQSFKFVD